MEKLDKLKRSLWLDPRTIFCLLLTGPRGRASSKELKNEVLLKFDESAGRGAILPSA